MNISRGYTKDIKLSIKEMRTEYKYVHIYKWSPFLKAMVLMLFDKYKECSYNEYLFCCYGNKNPCWVEIEGQDFGWMFLNFEGDINGIRRSLLDNMLSMIDSSENEDCRVIIGESKLKSELLIINQDGSNYLFMFND